MRRSLAMTFGAVLALSGCASVTLDSLSTSAEALDYDNLVGTFNRALAESHQDQPFDAGRVYVVAEEHGELHTYSLVRCQGGTHICGGSGGVGHLQQTPDYDVITGAYRDRVFYLSPGGDGYLLWRGEFRDLAWN